MRIEHLRVLGILQYRYEWQVAVALGEVEPVADDKVIGDLETKIIDIDVLFAPLKFIEQRHQLNTGGATRFEICQQVGKGQTSVNDVLDYEYVATFYGHVQILHYADFAGRARG